MDTKETTWETLSYEEKNHQLFVKQKELLELFLAKRAISRQDPPTPRGSTAFPAT